MGRGFEHARSNSNACGFILQMFGSNPNLDTVLMSRAIPQSPGTSRDRNDRPQPLPSPI
jgi:hypothetical protein